MNDYTWLRKSMLARAHDQHITPAAYVFAERLAKAHPGGLVGLWADLDLAKAVKFPRPGTPSYTGRPPRQASPLINPLQRQFNPPTADQSLTGTLQYARVARQQLKQTLEGARVHVAFDAGITKKILGSGGFQNQFVTGTSRGSLNLDLRRDNESSMFGIHHDAPAAHRPVYGFMADPEDVHGWEQTDSGTAVPGHSVGVRQYGTAIARLSPSVHPRTTITVGDSLLNERYSTRERRPVPLATPWPTALGRHDYDQFSSPASAMRHVPYIEAQIHGGVPLSHVEHVHFMEPSVPYKTTHQKLAQRLFDEHGITSSVTRQMTGQGFQGISKPF